MKIGKIIKVGDSMAVVIPRSHLRMLGWLRGDVVAQEVLDDQLVFRNMRQPVTRTVHTRKEYGDALRDRS